MYTTVSHACILYVVVVGEGTVIEYGLKYAADAAMMQDFMNISAEFHCVLPMQGCNSTPFFVEQVLFSWSAINHRNWEILQIGA